jgi:pyruvate dehydrogenase E1 component
MELPALDYYEPCFAVEVEWALLEGLRQCCDRRGGRSTYLRLSTKPVDQSLMEQALERRGREGLCRDFLEGGYLLREARQEPLVHLVSCGAMIPEAMEAADFLEHEGIGANLIHLCSPRRAYRNWRAFGARGVSLLAGLIAPHQRTAPIVTVIDGAAGALAWLGSVFGQRLTPLGVQSFGQSGSRRDLYRSMHIDVDSILEAAFEAVEES